MSTVPRILQEGERTCVNGTTDANRWGFGVSYSTEIALAQKKNSEKKHGERVGHESAAKVTSGVLVTNTAYLIKS